MPLRLAELYLFSVPGDLEQIQMKGLFKSTGMLYQLLVMRAYSVTKYSIISVS